MKNFNQWILSPISSWYFFSADLIHKKWSEWSEWEILNLFWWIMLVQPHIFYHIQLIGSHKWLKLNSLPWKQTNPVPVKFISFIFTIFTVLSCVEGQFSSSYVSTVPGSAEPLYPSRVCSNYYTCGGVIAIWGCRVPPIPTSEQCSTPSQTPTDILGQNYSFLAYMNDIVNTELCNSPLHILLDNSQHKIPCVSESISSCALSCQLSMCQFCRCCSDRINAAPNGASHYLELLRNLLEPNSTNSLFMVNSPSHLPPADFPLLDIMLGSLFVMIILMLSYQSANLLTVVRHTELVQPQSLYGGVINIDENNGNEIQNGSKSPQCTPRRLLSSNMRLSISLLCIILNISRPVLGSSNSIVFPSNSVTRANSASTNLNFIQDFTIECWLQRFEINTFMFVIFYGIWGSVDNALHFGLRNSNVLTLDFWADTVESNQQYLDTYTWHYFVVTYTIATRQAVLYDNGVIVGTGNIGPFTFTGSAPIEIGHLSYYGGLEIHGKLEQFRIYPAAFSSQDINAHYLDDYSLTAVVPMLYYPFSEGTGTKTLNYGSVGSAADLDFALISGTAPIYFSTSSHKTTQGCVAPTFQWSSAGPISGRSCIQITEPADPYGWNDNYLCSPNHDLSQWSWSYAGQIGGMLCTLWSEPGDAYGWNDNYLCRPTSELLFYEWSFAGSLPGKNCVQTAEPAEPSGQGWWDNYWCASCSTPIIVLSSSANPISYGGSVTFTASITSGATGSITFKDGSVSLGDPVTISGTMATYTTTALSAGSHSITSVYSGDSIYSAVTSASITQNCCAVGSYISSSSCVLCPAGSYCPSGSASAILCPAGSYCPTTGLSIGIVCPAGKYCPTTGLTTATTCPAGSYCPTTSLLSATTCPVGSYCPTTGLSSATACPAGKYCPTTGLTTSGTICPIGAYCATTGLSVPTACPGGSYCPFTGSTAVGPDCPIAYYCPSGSESTTECPIGSYCPSVRLSLPTPCPPGSYCPINASSTTSPCQAGFYCPTSGLSLPLNCSIGYYCPGTQFIAQLTCPSSYYCPNANTVQPIICPASYYCPTATSSPVPCAECPVGSSGPGLCVAGFYCVNGSSLICPAGFYCPAQSFSVPVPCQIGFFCTQSGLPAPTGPCNPGTYCPIGTINPLTCPAGTYSLAISANCYNCSSGFYSSSGSGSCSACTAGYTSVYKSGSPDCLQCPASYFCPQGISIEQAILCPSRSLYCTVGSSIPLSVNPGFLSSGCNLNAGCNGTEICPAGSACFAGIARLCDRGSFSPAGFSFCQLCSIGQFAPNVGSTICSNCSVPGTFTTTEGATICSGCSAGFYALALAAGSIPINCTACDYGKYTAATNSLACTDCPAGKYTSGRTATACIDCQAGKYSPYIGFPLLCIVCTSGSASSNDSGSSSCALCPPGYYCPLGSSLVAALPCSSTSQYCPGGTKQPQTVENGYYNYALNSTGGRIINVEQLAVNRSVCEPGNWCNSGIRLACTAGKYTMSAASSVCSDCSPGRFSNSTGTTNCFICDMGKLSNPGSTVCTGCQPGSFHNLTSLQCEPCSLGYKSAGSTTSCTACSAGQYTINPGSVNCINCGPGLYAPNIGFGESECRRCSAGEASSNNSQSSTCIRCPAGYYCPLGSAIDAALRCSSASQYCPGGTKEPLTVEPGYYSYAFNSTGGKMIDVAELAVNRLPCEVGYACSGGIRAICAAGKYTASPVSSACNDCGEGRYSKVVGSTNCSSCDLGSSSSEGSTICSGCQPGSFSNMTSGTCELCPLGYKSSGSTTLCAICSAGEYTFKQGAIDCIACGPGLYTPTPGYTGSSCMVCESGKASTTVSGSSSCTDCPVGYYCPAGSSLATALACSSASQYCPGATTEPQPIELGFYNYRFNSTTGADRVINVVVLAMNRTACELGYACNGGIRSICTAGKYTSTIGNVACAECEVGRYVNTLGATYCSICQPGRATSASGSTICTGCQPGAFSNLTSGICEVCPRGSISGSNAIRCELCFAGQYTPTDGSVICIPSPAGEYTPVPGWNKLPLPCPAGTFSSTGFSYCKECGPGQFSEAERSVSCQTCARGSYSAMNRSTACPGCPAGRFADDLGSMDCTACPNGRFSSSNFSSSCADCRPPLRPINDRTYCAESLCRPGQEDDGQSQCLLCPAGKFSRGQGARCEVCAAQSYAPVAGSFECISCAAASGFICERGLAIIKPDFWGYLIVNRPSHSNIYPATTTQAFVPGSNTTEILIQGQIEVRAKPCPTGFCIGGQTIGLAATSDPSSILSQAATSGSSEYSIPSSMVQNQGSAQQTCAPSRDSSPNNVLCGQCVAGKTAWNGACVDCPSTKGDLLFALILFSFCYVYILFRLSKNSSSDVKLLIYFIQTAIFQLGPFDTYLSWLGFINFNVTQSSGSTCVTPLTPYQTLAMSALIPIFFVIELLLIMGAHWLWSKYSHRMACLHKVMSSQDDSSSAPVFPFKRYTRTVVSLCLFGYLQISTSCILFLRCIEVNGQSVLFANPAIDCRSQTYRNWLGLVLVLVIIVVCLVPVSLALFLARHRKAIQLRDVEFRTKYGILFESYGIHAWYWQPYVLVRQVVLIAVAVSLQGDHSAKYLGFTYLNLAVYSINAWIRPNARKAENRIESVSHLLLVIMSAFLATNPPPYSVGQQVFIFMLIVPFALGLAALVTLIRIPRKACQQLAVQLKLRGFETDVRTGKIEIKGVIPAGQQQGIELQSGNSTTDADDYGPSLSTNHISQHQRSYSNNPVLDTLRSEGSISVTPSHVNFTKDSVSMNGAVSGLHLHPRSGSQYPNAILSVLQEDGESMARVE